MQRPKAYRCQATSIDGLVQQVAVSYLRHGYWYYVTGMIPEEKDPEEIDSKLIARYQIDVTERERASRKRSGLANMQYIRHESFFLLMCSQGLHEFRQREEDLIRDARKVPILIPKVARLRRKKKKHADSRLFEGYAVSYRRGHWARKSEEDKTLYKELRGRGERPARGERDHAWRSRVEIEKRTYRRLRAYFLNIAPHRSVQNLAHELDAISYQPYAPVRQQLLALVRDINKVRKIAGVKLPVPYEVLNLKRVQIHPFAERNAESNESRVRDVEGATQSRMRPKR
ncbi:hypothetical protein [Bythopirellula goksoeyrii]|uniref:hypothetical protein n=1 Tax=Bythopirellula goksoeyrii TaxID=1400387 RepID=UPI0011CD59CE|nr:hypothetical protein [Bythopirellula goksoeyrii]